MTTQYNHVSDYYLTDRSLWELGCELKRASSLASVLVAGASNKGEALDCDQMVGALRTLEEQILAAAKIHADLTAERGEHKQAMSASKSEVLNA